MACDENKAVALVLGAESGRPGWGPERNFYCPRPGRGFRMVWVWKVYEDTMDGSGLAAVPAPLHTPSSRMFFSLHQTFNANCTLYFAAIGRLCEKCESNTPSRTPHPVLLTVSVGICCGAPAGLESLRPEACRHWMPGCNQRPPPRPHSNLHILDSV